jgi:CDP-diacylglycerol---glycerol-3-phosphate 3-phosphatidyltransferase
VSPENALRGLGWRWLGLAGVSLLLLVSIYAFLFSAWFPYYALRWLAVGATALAYLLWTLWHNLPHNQPLGRGTLYPDLGLPNLVTWWRGFLVACATGFLFSPWPADGLAWLPAIFYASGILPDYLDGYLARRFQRSSLLGENLDVAVDSLAVLSGVLLIVQYGQVPAWYLLVGLARYIYLLGLWLRERHGLPVYDLPPSLGRRALAGVQMGFTMVMLWPLFGPPGTHVAAYLFAVPFLFNFTRDWFYASGVLKPAPDRVRQPLSPLLLYWLPLLVRLLIAVSLGKNMFAWLRGREALMASFSATGVQFPAVLVVLLIALQVYVVVGLILGVTGRTAAILALGLLGLNLRLGLPLTLETILVAAGSALILYLGTGAYSIWSPEAELLQHRAGEGI